MKVTILNGNADAANSFFDGYLRRLSDELGADGHDVNVFQLRAMDLKHCTGCFGCWVKTPGKCVVADDTPEMLRAAINSDFVLWASPVIMGFYSALLKQVTDKYIPLLHPYTVFVEGETHHAARYDKYPRIGLLLEKGDDADDEDIGIISDIHRRTALNFKSPLSFTRLTSDPVADAARDVARSAGIARGSGGAG
jgi:multimeric flavodoxin WrbA